MLLYQDEKNCGRTEYMVTIEVGKITHNWRRLNVQKVSKQRKKSVS